MNDDMKLITEIKAYEDDIENLKYEIIDLKTIVEVKEKELLERIVMEAEQCKIYNGNTNN